MLCSDLEMNSPIICVVFVNLCYQETGVIFIVMYLFYNLFVFLL